MVRRKSQLAADILRRFCKLGARGHEFVSARSGTIPNSQRITGFQEIHSMGRPMSPRPINPMAGFKRSLLGCSRRATSAYSAQNEETIVAESRPG